MTFKNLSLALCSLLLVSCGSDGAGPKAKTTKAEKRGVQAMRESGTQDDLDSGNKSVAAKPSGSTWGRIYLDDSEGLGVLKQDQDIFQKQVQLLLEPQFKADEVGFVNGIDDSALSADEKYDTGIAFWGTGLSLSSGFDPSKMDYPESNRVFDEDTASLRVSVYWSITKAGEEVSVIQEVPIHFNYADPNRDSGKLVDSYINGNYIQLIFADEFGKVSLSGNFDQDNFIGRVHFLTDKIDQDDDGVLEEVKREAQFLGKFSVKTCGFFTCAN